MIQQKGGDVGLQETEDWSEHRTAVVCCEAISRFIAYMS